MSVRILIDEYLTRRDARKPNGTTAFDFSCFRCNDCSGCDCCWPPGRCHGPHVVEEEG